MQTRDVRSKLEMQAMEIAELQKKVRLSQDEGGTLKSLIMKSLPATRDSEKSCRMLAQEAIGAMKMLYCIKRSFNRGILWGKLIRPAHP